MATYNGANVVTRQLRSIVEQLSSLDQIVIVDDRSTDDTLKIVKKNLADFSGEIVIKKNKKNIGPIKSFEQALKFARNDLIFLSDQDDKWYPDKVAEVSRIYQDKKAAIILHDARVINGQGQTIDDSWNHYNSNNTDQTVFNNLMKNGFTGAMMAISKPLLDDALPFPNNIEMHDQWFFLVAKKNKLPIYTTKKILMDYIRYGSNYTGMKKRSKFAMISGRVNMLIDYSRLKRSAEK